MFRRPHKGALSPQHRTRHGANPVHAHSDPHREHEWKVREIVKRYSDFCEYPIQMEVTRTTPKLDEDGEPVADEMEEVTELETLNSRKPLWARPKDEITAEEHAEFYRHLTHDWNEPLEPIHFQVEGTLEYTALLYLPKERPLDLFDPSNKASIVSLYVKRVLIQRSVRISFPPGSGSSGGWSSAMTCP